MLLRRKRHLATALLVMALSLTGCKGGNNSNGGTASGGTSGGGATEVGPSTPNGGKIFTHVENSPCVPSRSGKVIIKGSGATPHDSFDVTVYYPLGSKNILQPNGRPAFANSVRADKDGDFAWTFHCGSKTKHYPIGQYKVELSYDGSAVKTEAFDVSEPKG